MLKELNDILSCPVIIYTSFKQTDVGNMNNCTTIDKFKFDMQELLKSGYTSMSLRQIHECRNSHALWPNKAFCLIFKGGYIDNYTLAFPVIKELNIHVDIFVSTDLVGVNEYPEVSNFTPHFGWDQAQEMCDSRLVNIFALWHPFDECKPNKEQVIEGKVIQIINKISGNDARLAFFYDKFDYESLDILHKLRISINLINYLNITLNNIQAGCVPTICINYNSNIFDIIDNYKATCTSLLEREESLLPDKSLHDINWNNNNFETLVLPIEKHPLVRNYLRHAFPLSVLATGRKDKAEYFVLNEYIDIIFRPWYHWFDYDNHLYDSWDCICCRRISRDIIEENRIDVIAYIINGLKIGYYSDLWLDTFYIPGKPGYNSMHLTHCLLVYGYDKDNDVLNTLTYTNSGMYEQLDVHPNDIIRACSNNYFQYINMLKRNDNSQVEYNISILKRKLYNYINSIYSYEGNTKYNKINNDQLCNFKACEAFSEYIESTAKKENKIYSVALYGFSEHKKYMAWRLKFICSHENIDCNEVDLFVDYANIKCDFLINACVKFNMKNSASLLSKIVNTINDLVVKEKSAITSLLNLFGI